jgi:hypothetical protein
MDVTFPPRHGVPRSVIPKSKLMKTPSALLAIACCCLPLSVLGQAPPPDRFEEGMRQAFADYKKGDHEAVTAKLRELLKLMEERGAAKVAALLPDELNGWKGENLVREDLGMVGGGVSIARTYSSGNREIKIKAIKDSPLVKQLIPLLTNEDLIRASNRKTHRIAGETAIMDGERKLQMVLDQRIFVEITGDDTIGEKELVAAARLLDLRALAKLK